MDDDDKIKQVDIFQYFKLLDIGVQASEVMKDVSLQYGQDFILMANSVGIMTDDILRKSVEIQVATDEINEKSNVTKKKAPSGDKGNNKIIKRNDSKKKTVYKLN